MSKPRVLVIGESCVDRFVYGETKRLSPEAPVPVFNPIRVEENKGMASNVCENLRSLCQEEFEVSGVFHVGGGQPIKTRYVDEHSNQQFIRIDEHENRINYYPRRNSFLDQIFLGQEKPVAVIISDYNKGLLSSGDLEDIAKLCRERRVITFLDSKKLLGNWVQDFNFIKINRSEADHCLLYDSGIINTLIENGQLIITEGIKGASYMDRLVPVVSSHPVQDVCGAGDTFLAALAFKFLQQNQEKDYRESENPSQEKIRYIWKSLRYANAAAAYAVSQRGVVVVKPGDFSFDGKQERADSSGGPEEGEC